MSIQVNLIKTYKLTNKNGVEIEFISLGGKLKSIKIPDRNGVIDDILLGYNLVEEYINGDLYSGAICGRYANRIEDGRYEYNGNEIQLTINQDGNHLHGGFNGFHNRIWNIEEAVSENGVSSYILTLESADGEEGNEGDVSVKVMYSLNNNNEFIIDYEATTNKPTHVNLTSHGYFNLKGEGNGDIKDHVLKINADNYTPLTEKSVPSGEIRTVSNTAMDFRKAKKVGSVTESKYRQIQLVGGIDHNWVLNGNNDEMKLAVELYEELSGRLLQMHTTQPGAQIYVGLHFDGEKGKSGRPYNKYAGIAIEGQHFPNSPNIKHFPSTLLLPGGIYRQKTIYTFKTQ